MVRRPKPRITPTDKNADALLNYSEDEIIRPRETSNSSKAATPFDQVFSAFLTTRGEVLEMMSRTNRSVAIAAYRNHTRLCKYNTDFDNAEHDFLFRLSISTGGKGREEMVKALQSGSGVPGEYYGGGRSGGYEEIDTQTIIPEDEDE